MSPLDLLHVEDDPHCVELTQRALRRLPHAPAYYALPDGEQALALLAARPVLPRLLLLDLRLTTGTGLELLATLRADSRTQHLPIVMFTSSQEQRDVAEAYRLGANSYVIKPLAYKPFMEAVAQVVDYWFGVNYHQS
jgi:two-component system response regulator